MKKIDSTWYKKPNTPIPQRLTAGGIVARKDGNSIYIALIIEGRFTEFSLPKGGVKEGEELLDAAKREIHEEAGLSRLQLHGYLGKRERLNITKRRWITVHYFLFTTDQKSGTPTDQEKNHELEWFSIDRLPPMLWPEQKRLIVRNRERIEKLFT